MMESPVQVYIEYGLLRAHVVKTRLESAGIPVALAYESVGPVIGITTDGIGEVRILVPLRYVDQARELLSEPCDPIDESSLPPASAN